MKILVLQHLAVEHPGVFRELWGAEGHVWHPVELDTGEEVPALDDFDLLVAMGGPMDVWQEAQHPWLVREKEVIRRWVRDLDRPYLGICLGHQLLAAALGGEVDLMASPEVGLADVELTAAGRGDPLLQGLTSPVRCFQWHGAEITRLPPGAEILAANAACATQAIRVGRHAYGFQYHCEITETTVADWSEIPEYALSLKAALGAERAAGLEIEVAGELAGLRRAAQTVNANLMNLIRQTV